MALRFTPSAATWEAVLGDAVGCNELQTTFTQTTAMEARTPPRLGLRRQGGTREDFEARVPSWKRTFDTQKPPQL